MIASAAISAGNAEPLWQHQMTNRESIQNQIAELVAAEPSPEETRSRALAQLLALAWWAKRQPANV